MLSIVCKSTLVQFLCLCDNLCQQWEEGVSHSRWYCEAQSFSSAVWTCRTAGVMLQAGLWPERKPCSSSMRFIYESAILIKLIAEAFCESFEPLLNSLYSRICLFRDEWPTLIYLPLHIFCLTFMFVSAFVKKKDKRTYQHLVKFTHWYWTITGFINRGEPIFLRILNFYEIELAPALR